LLDLEQLLVINVGQGEGKKGLVYTHLGNSHLGLAFHPLNHLDHPRQVSLGQVGTGRQAETFGEQFFSHTTTNDFAVLKDWLQMHRFLLTGTALIEDRSYGLDDQFQITNQGAPLQVS
jgi:hypothetical protein